MNSQMKITKMPMVVPEVKPIDPRTFNWSQTTQEAQLPPKAATFGSQTLRFSQNNLKI